MIYILTAILIIEFARLVMAVTDSRNVRALNKKIAEQNAKAVEWAKLNALEWGTMRKAELEGISELAASSTELAKIFEALKAETEVTK